MLYLSGLDLEPLRDWDEATFAQVARELRARGLPGVLSLTL